MPSISRFSATLFAACAGLAFGASALAQAFPTKPITIISAYPPGGGGDVIARMMAPRLAQRLGQNVVIDNKPGASGNIATDFVARAPADGYTILINNATVVLNAALGMPQSFKVQQDLKYLTAVASTPVAIAVHPSVPAKNVEELVTWMSQNKASYASCGNGSPQHLAGARFAQLAKLDVVHVAYKGCAPAVMDGIAGTVPVLFNTVPNLEAQVKAGKLRYIAIAAQQRIPFKPDLPTVAETKGFASFEAEVWFGFIGPAKLPPAVAKRIEQELLAVARDKDVQTELADRYFSLRVLDSAQFEKQIASDLVSWKRLADELKIKLD
ncbi:MAG: tripartite tricarboxylate transporter substrate-binding protein [Pseudomonadota bacterium]